MIDPKELGPFGEIIKKMVEAGGDTKEHARRLLLDATVASAREDDPRVIAHFAGVLDNLHDASNGLWYTTIRLINAHRNGQKLPPFDGNDTVEVEAYMKEMNAMAKDDPARLPGLPWVYAMFTTAILCHDSVCYASEIAIMEYESELEKGTYDESRQSGQGIVPDGWPIDPSVN